MMFEKLVWKHDRMLLDDLVFRLNQVPGADGESAGGCFDFVKLKPLVDEFARFFSRHPDFRPQNVFELGIWDGGSVAFWHEVFRPAKHVAIDLGAERLYPNDQRDDSPYFKRYVASRGLDQKVKTYWGVDQADVSGLRAIVAREFSHPLDLVIDDASHQYRLTKVSFETLFPLVRPGGFYVIEDWAWGLWPEFDAPDHPWVNESELTRLVVELVEASGTAAARTSPAPIASLSIHSGFVVVERGQPSATELGDFRLEDHIYHRAVRRPLLAPA